MVPALLVRGRWSFALLLLTVLVGCLDVESASVQDTMNPPIADADHSEGTSPHPPIVVEGEDDLCRAENVVDGKDTATGIINCATADGSAGRPYLISGWRLELYVDSECLQTVTTIPRTACAAPETCKDNPVMGALVICRTKSHVVIRDVEVHVGFSSDAPVRHPVDARGLPVAVSLYGAANVVLQNVLIRSYGAALYALTARGQGDKVWTVDGLVIKESHFESLFPESVVPQGSPSAIYEPFVLVQSGQIHAVGNRIDAAGASHAIHADARNRPDTQLPAAVYIEENVIANARQIGLRVSNASAEIHGNRFEGNGNGVLVVSPSFPYTMSDDAAVLASASVLIEGSFYNLTGNVFRVPGRGTVGVALETSRPGSVELNAFTQEAPSGFALVNSRGFGCQSRLAYNDFADLRVRNQERECQLYAPYNWWGGPDGPSGNENVGAASGPMITSPWLSRSFTELPVVTVESHKPGAVVQGQLQLQGSAENPTSDPLVRVEGTLELDGWDGATHAEGITQWILKQDLSTVHRGAFPYWVRACDETDCGVPGRLDLHHVLSSDSPIALLAADPDVTQVGEPVVLDAGRSYSPYGASIAHYRFVPGKAGALQWQQGTLAEVIYRTPGTHVATVNVEDEEGYTNLNSPYVTIRVIEDDESDRAVAPGSGPIVVVIIWICLSRWWRRPK